MFFYVGQGIKGKLEARVRQHPARNTGGGATFQDMMHANVALEGVCTCDKNMSYLVRISEWHTIYGSGDYEDPPEQAEGEYVRCWYVWFEDLAARGSFNTGGGT